jgi:hypothetical protein
MGLRARFYWEKYLNGKDWPRTMAYAVRKQLDKLGLSVSEAIPA